MRLQVRGLYAQLVEFENSVDFRALDLNDKIMVDSFANMCFESIIAIDMRAQRGAKRSGKGAD